MTGPEPRPPIRDRASERATGAVRAVVERLRRPRSRRAQVIIAVTAVVLLAMGTAAAIASLPDDTSLTWWPLLVLVGLGTPWSLVLLTAEVQMTGRLAHVELDRRTSLRVAVIGTAMNQLPLPGAALTRMDAMVAAGAGVRRSTTAIVVVGLVWVAVSLVVAGVSLVGTSWVFALLLAGGLIVTVGVWRLGTGLLAAADRGAPARLVLLELLFTLTTAGRFALALIALDATFPLRAPFTMAASGALSTAMGIAPGGLGIKEGLATLFGDLAGVPVAIALLAAVIDRLASVIGALLSSLIVLPLTSRRTPPSETAFASNEAGSDIDP